MANSQQRTQELVQLLKEVFKLFKNNMAQAFVDSGMTPPQAMVIGALHKSGKIKTSELTAQLYLSNSSVSSLLDRMEKQEMVVRERSSEDKRVVYVRLTPKYQQMENPFKKLADEKFQDIVSHVTDSDMETVFKGLSILKGVLTQNLGDDGSGRNHLDKDVCGHHPF